jgi:penicillin-binding protein 1A
VTPDDEKRYDEVLGHIAARRRMRRKDGRRRGRRSIIATFVVVAVCVFFAMLAAGAVGTVVVVKNIVAGDNLSSMKQDPPGVTTVIYDRYGHVLAKVPSTQNRTPVPASKISLWLMKATVAIEDRRFYQEGGVDYQGILRAFFANVGAGHVVQGGSTIEQQLARNLYLHDDSQTYTRKIREAWLAMQIADKWSKTKILTEYLNIVPYGGVTYGCEAAAETYFSVHCKDLKIAQSALLAGLPQSPTDYNPNLHPKLALQRRNQVLLAMYQNGDLTAQQYRRNLGTKLRLNPSSSYGQTKQPYFVQYVESVINQRIAEGRYPKGALQNGGLEIHTTIDPRMQAAAHRAILNHLNQPGDPAAAIVSIDPKTGEILSFDASTNFRRTKYDLPAQAHRQAGSAFKPFGLLAGMVGLGIDPETTIYSGQSPFVYPFPNCVGYKSCTWTVNNAEQTSVPNMNLHDALDGSINAVFARFSIDIGAQRTVQMAYRLGIPRSDHLPDVYSIILGTGLVSPLDMATAYSTIADQGVRHQPLAITGVDSYNGNVNDPSPGSKNPGKQVVPAWATYELTSILKDNLTCATGLCTGGAADLSPYRPAAGKTGTVEAHNDAWFCGYTPNLTTCVWMGFPAGEISMENSPVGAAGSFGGGVPAEIWHDYMSTVFSEEASRYPPVDWPYVQAPADAYRPFTSQFPLTAPPPKKQHKPANGGGKANGNNTGGNGNGNSNGSGNGGGNGNGGGGGGTGGGPPSTT